MEELVVTDTSLPDRIGANTESRGSALCLMLSIFGKVSWKHFCINRASTGTLPPVRPPLK